MQNAPRCGAKTKSRSGKPCQSPGMLNGRCRMHGGLSPGAPKGNQHAFKHGRYSARSIAERRQSAALIRAIRAGRFSEV
nr:MULTISPECIES: HGGxSTG domain-containing protein [unclassified Bradyrhizobium]